MSDVNIIFDILKAMQQARPDSVFINSLYQQYCNRGGLSKKQLEGLHSKASKTEGISSSKLVTLEAIIRKKPTRYKSEIIPKAPEPAKDETSLKLIAAILAKYPQHKRVIFLQSKYNNNDLLTTVEIAELERFGKLLLK